MCTDGDDDAPAVDDSDGGGDGGDDDEQAGGHGSGDRKLSSCDGVHPSWNTLILA